MVRGSGGLVWFHVKGSSRGRRGRESGNVLGSVSVLGVLACGDEVFWRMRVRGGERGRE